MILNVNGTRDITCSPLALQRIIFSQQYYCTSSIPVIRPPVMISIAELSKLIEQYPTLQTLSIDTLHLFRKLILHHKTAIKIALPVHETNSTTAPPYRSGLIQPLGQCSLLGRVDKGQCRQSSTKLAGSSYKVKASFLVDGGSRRG